MNSPRRRGLYLLSCILGYLWNPLLIFPQTAPPVSATSAEWDGRHDFDWDIGTWRTHQRRLLHPLTGSTTWVEYNGTDVVRKIWDGANTGLVEADGPAGRLEIFALRLYNPQAHQWGISFTNPTGTLSPPAIGEFKNGRGEFYDQEAYNGRTILVRFSVSDITPNSCHFEQAFSADGGKTWEPNFIVTETRIKDESAQQNSGATKASLQSTRTERDGQHDFDFEIGTFSNSKDGTNFAANLTRKRR